MKTMKFILFLMMLILVAACSKDGFIPGDSSSQFNGENSLLKNVHSGQVFTVQPNGNDDTQNILKAFADAKNAGPGSIVQLVEGVYSIGFIEIRDFNGFFRGAGKNKTKIQNADKLPACTPIYTDNLFPVLLSFIGGDVEISKMTFSTKDGPLCSDDPYYGFLACMLGLSDYSGKYVPPVRFIKAVVEEVDFIGGKNNVLNYIGTDHNLNMTVYVGAKIWINGPNDPYSSADVTFKHCLFNHAGIGFDTWGLDERSTVIFEDNIIKNSFYNFFVFANLGLKAYIRNNYLFDAPMGTYIDDSDYGIMPFQLLKKRSEFYISENHFKSLAGSTNLYIHDARRTIYPDEGLPQLFDLRNNTFSTEEGGTAINSLNNVDAMIWNNKFYGTGTDGIYIDGDATSGTYAEKIKLFGNNFCGAKYTNAGVYLGSYSRNCTVVGVSTDMVDDEGVNNSIIGTKAHKQYTHSNHYIHENFRLNKEHFIPKGFR